MRALAFVVASLIPLAAQQSASDRRAIELGQQVSVSALDPDLPRKPLLPWLTQTLGPTAKIEWEVTDCGEQTGNPDLDRGRDFPLCVDAVVSYSDGRMAIVSVLMGTFQKGLVGSPALWSVNVKNGARFDAIPRLGDLPKTVGTN
jgi:hypothetical protein